MSTTNGINKEPHLKKISEQPSDEESDNPMDAVGGYFPEIDFTVPAEKPVSVPTPASLALYVIGFVGLIGLGWSRRKRYS